jgi:DNA-directed RNA polymerase specialized sigma24 family protein
MSDSLTFAALYAETFASSVRYVCVRFRLSAAVAEDLVQDVFLYLWQEHPTLVTLENPYAYLRVCIRHKVLAYYQHRFLVQEQSIDVPGDAGQPDACQSVIGSLTRPELSVEDQVCVNLRLQEAAFLIHQLPSWTQLMLQMSIAGYGYDEIHQYLVATHDFTGSVEAIDHRLHRARQQLRAAARVQKVQARMVQRSTKHRMWPMHVTGCVTCGTTARPHLAKGQCRRCYDAARHRTHQGPARSLAAKLQWAKQYTSCVMCGTTQIAHCAQGKCNRCYNRALRQQRTALLGSSLVRAAEVGTSAV